MTSNELTVQRRKHRRSVNPWSLKVLNGMTISAGGTPKSTVSTSTKRPKFSTARI